ncbi:glycoside hydrolase family 15 protein [Solicola sp. PLA-1-18]|uniref:glycoside hydrolase family 15 protein n=1 Tax=Solicola sp. PLA-1-18 TaxID=3380532 RepID=UPI003B79F18E
MTQNPIAEHGLIGDLRTAALVGMDGTVAWFCAGRFDSPSVFGSILDDEKGGAWRIHPVDGSSRSQQFYYPSSNVLITRFMNDEGVVEVHDFMPIVRPHDPDHRQRIVRRLVGVRGQMTMRLDLSARPDYAREEPTTREHDGCVLIESDTVRLALSATVDLDVDGPDVSSEVTLRSGEKALFVLEVLTGDADGTPCDSSDTDELFDTTVAFWQHWLSRSTYTGRWREMVDRSALTLKLLTHEPSGAIVAAPTTSLPEDIGGERNWDYRYVWIRDAAFSIYALLRLGFTEEAEAFMRWLSERIGEADGHELGPLRVMYTIDGSTEMPEIELDHLSGYAGSRPVRVGNGAAEQLQLDIYGEIIDSAYLFNKYGAGISHDAWKDLTHVLDWVLDNWDQPDAGMWEARSEPQDYTTGRLMAWVAVERMIRVARQRGLPADLERWCTVRDEIYAQVMERGWNDEIGAFTQVLDGTALDASILLMPLVKFVAPNDPRFLSTLEAVKAQLVEDSLVFRYRMEDDHGDLGVDDGLTGNEGTFSLCSFWYVEALTRAGQLPEARLALEKMFTYSNHLGLYAEMIGITGDQLGNYPQAFTHLSLVSAAINLDRSLG